MAALVSNVYDLLYASPVTLKEIAANAVAVELWRCELNKHRTNDNLNEFLSSPNISLKNLIPNTPSSIELVIEERIKKFAFSVTEWLRDYPYKVLDFHRSDRNSILHDFNDFKCDWDGTIHYVRTAKQMIMCDRLSAVEKFNVACVYCFENEVRRLWLPVSETLDLNEIDFDQCPQLYYWICSLKNELNRIPNQHDDSVDEIMLYRGNFSNNWSSMEYFWSRIRPENRFKKAVLLSERDDASFARFFLPKLYEEELGKFVAECGGDFIHGLFISVNLFYVLPTWMYIKDKMNENNFTKLIEKLAENETNNHISEEVLNETCDETLKGWPHTEDETYLFCEIWRNASDELKQSAITIILSKEKYWLFDRECMGIKPTEFREIRFLLSILSDASFEQRNAFWNNTWLSLIDGTRPTDLHRIMKLCFENENDIAKFKETTMAVYENISPYCVEVMKTGCFNELNDTLVSCCPETEKRKDFKRRLLRSCFLGEDSVFCFTHLIKVKPMNEFIDDAFDDADLAADFKNQVLYTHEAIMSMSKCITSMYSHIYTINFVDTFASNEQVVEFVKQGVLKSLRYHLITDSSFMWEISADNLRVISVWCLGNDEEVANFKQSLSLDDFFQNMAPVEFHQGLVTSEREKARYRRNFDEFLKWYFDSPEESEKFKKGIPDELKHFLQ
ncbi:uncharacterized protein LOC135849264 [Planococcus citri]|uniref:uncharacterized protein LOC135849264 n=1 Tax=Planococcus citri TaxID=170843 RepID=UPI0031F7AF12